MLHRMLHLMRRWATAIVVLFALVPGTSAAADRFDQGGYVYLAPGLIAVPVGDDDIEDIVNVSYQWGFGGGYMFSPGRHFRIAIGGAFEHAPANLENDSISGPFVRADVDAHLFRLVPELRIGGGTDRFFGYGLVSPGLALVHWRWRGMALGFESSDEDTDAGFNLGLRAGAQGLVWRGLMIGGEFGGSLAFISNGGDDNITTDDYGVHTIDVRLMVGWYF
jgi:hypothetical protein